MKNKPSSETERLRREIRSAVGEWAESENRVKFIFSSEENSPKTKQIRASAKTRSDILRHENEIHMPALPQEIHRRFRRHHRIGTAEVRARALPRLPALTVAKQAHETERRGQSFGWVGEVGGEIRSCSERREESNAELADRTLPARALNPKFTEL